MQLASLNLLLLGAAAAAAAAPGCGGTIDGSYAALLVVTEAEPLAGPSAGGTAVTLRGRRFCDDMKVTFGAAPAERVTVASDELAVVVAPNHPLGEAALEVTCGSDKSRTPSPFRYFATTVVFQRDVDMPPIDGRSAFGDVDGDGLDDLFDLRTDALTIFRNTGRNGFDGSPIIRIPYPAGESNASLALPFVLADFTGDGSADVLLFLRAATDPVSTPRMDGLVLYLFAGESGLAEVGRLRLPSSSPDPWFLEPIAMTDLDGDGRLDLILSDGPQEPVDGGVAYQVSMLPGLGRLVFGAPRKLFDVPSRPGMTARGTYGAFDQYTYVTERMVGPVRRDLDGDGLDDFVGRSSWFTPGTREVTWTLTYVRGARGGAPFTVIDVAGTDGDDRLFFHDDDGLPDLYRVQSSETAPNDRRLTIRRATGLGTFEETPRTYDLPCSVAQCRARETSIMPTRFDVDGDGDGEWLMIDNLMVTSPGRDAGAGGLAWLELGANTEVLTIAAGDGAFNHSLVGGVNQYLIGMPRMRRNGERAVLYHSHGAQAAYLDVTTDGRLTFRHTPPVLEQGDTFAACGGDFDGDGVPDLVATRSAARSEPPAEIAIYRGAGDGTFEQPRRLSARFPWWSYDNTCHVGHFNDDGRLDFHLHGLIFLGQPGGGFVPVDIASLNPDWSRGWISAELDADHDGADDLVVRNVGSTGPQVYRVFSATKDGSFRVTLEIPDSHPVTDGNIPPVRVADLDGDGLPDLVSHQLENDPTSFLWHVSITAEMSRRRAGGQIELVAMAPFETGGSTRAGATLQIADLDGDGRSEILLQAPLREVQVLGSNGTSLEVRRRFSDPNLGRFTALCNLAGRGPQDITFVAEPSLVGFSPIASGGRDVAPVIQWLDIPGAQLDGLAPADFAAPSACLDVNGDGLDEFLFVDHTLFGSSATERTYILHNVSQ